jgi:hypothetical protein
MTENWPLNSRRAWLLLAFTFLFPVHLIADDDPIADKLFGARLDYHKETERLRLELLETLQKKEDAARESGSLNLVKRIKEESEHFHLSGVLPSVVPTARYTQGVKKAKGDLKQAIQAAVKEYLIAKKDDLASELEPELDELKKELSQEASKPKPVKGKPNLTPTVVSEWIHQVETGGQTIRGELKLYSNGRIGEPNSTHTWSRQGRIMVLRWHESNGTFTFDVVTLSADGKLFEGNNQYGAVIKGMRQP